MRFYDTVDNDFFQPDCRSFEGGPLLNSACPRDTSCTSAGFRRKKMSMDSLRSGLATGKPAEPGRLSSSAMGLPQANSRGLHRYLRLRPIFTSQVTRASANSRHSMHLRGVSCSRARVNPGVLWSTKPWLRASGHRLKPLRLRRRLGRPGEKRLHFQSCQGWRSRSMSSPNGGCHTR